MAFLKVGPLPTPSGYLSVAHYLVLNKAAGLAAKRAALASGFCPPDLAGERTAAACLPLAAGGRLVQ
jgi:hypothetical protein